MPRHDATLLPPEPDRPRRDCRLTASRFDHGRADRIARWRIGAVPAMQPASSIASDPPEADAPADRAAGPTVEQGVGRVPHCDAPDDRLCTTWDIERRALARAVHDHLEDRGLRDERTTVVFGG